MNSYNWLVSRIASKHLLLAARNYASGCLLDIGCGSKSKEKIFAPYVEKYFGLDYLSSPHSLSKVDIIGTAMELPISDESVDTILCNAVLEHLERPWDAVKEMCRVLEHNGYAILTVPLFWHLHEEPRDFYRYTKYGLEYLLKDVGFEIVEIKPASGFIVTFSQELVYFLLRFRRGLFRWIIDSLSFLIQRCAYFLNRFDRSYQFTWMYLVIARKPNEGRLH